LQSSRRNSNEPVAVDNTLLLATCFHPIPVRYWPLESNSNR
jgi:hypothetical protein